MNRPPQPETPVDTPEVRSPAEERGARLQAWLEEHDLTAAQLSRMTGISEMSISKYLRGTTDLARLHHKTVTRLLTGMSVSDSWAQDYFLIPAELRDVWYSSRPAPMGKLAADPQHEFVTHHLTSPVKGDWSIPAPALVTVNPSRQRGLLLVRIGQRYWLTEDDAIPGQAEILGQFQYAAPVRGDD